MSTTSNPRRYVAGLASLAAIGIVAVASASPAAAASSTGDVHVVNTETVQVYASANGTPDSKRVYEQVAMTGKGKVDLANPVSTSGLRNLDGFSGFEVRDGKQLVKTAVDGEKKLRSVSDYKGSLPLDVHVTYELNGKKVSPGTVVGKKGHLKVTFVVENVTGRTQDISVPDGHGGTVTKSTEVAIPMVGSLSTAAPANFTNVRSSQANMAGDGQGGTKLSFTMTLFPPIGSTTATFGYEADVVDGVVPRVDISALPVNPLESPTFASAAKSYQGGADTGAQLTNGASQIDANLLKLRDGSAELLAGLIQLRDGAGDLKKGLNGQAAPGAKKLADGAGELSTGLGKLDDGAGQLKDGSSKLADGTGDLSDGTGSALAGGQKLTDGLSQISSGLGQLADAKTGLPKAASGIEQLKAGVDKLIANVALSSPFDPSNPKTLLDGLKALQLGIGSAQAPQTLLNGVTQIEGGLQQLTGPAGLPKAKGGVDQVETGLEGSLASLQTLESTMTTLKAVCAGNPTCQSIADGVIDGITKADGSRAQTNAAIAGLKAVSLGLGDAITKIDDLMIPGADQVLGGLTRSLTGVNTMIAGIGTPSQGTTLLGGLTLVRGGLDDLSTGLTSAVAGINKLDDGAGAAYAGSSTLTDGLGQLDAGANQLDDGAGKLSDGADQLADGAGDAEDGGTQVSDGATKLSSGLGDAADGSKLLFGGLIKAAGSAPQLPDGAQRLSTEGTKQLVAAGKDTAMSYGEMVAVIKAGAERAKSDDMAYGAPTGAIGLTAYSYVLRGEDGEGGRNVARALGGTAVLGAAGGLFFLRRRFLF